jgi:sulfotransferase family protein
MLPNFFVVGAPKSGTTSLYHYLDQHPAIYMSPVKEPAYFAGDLFDRKRTLGIDESDPAEMRAYVDGPMTERRNGVVRDWELYQKLFKNVTHETAIGEASGTYLASTGAPAAIRQSIPHARIVMILRDPVERLFSQHAEAAARGQARPEFLQWVQEQQGQGAIWIGFYGRHVTRYLDSFPAGQLHIVLYEDYAARPLSILRSLFEFLEVDPEFVVDVSRRHNVTWQPRFIGLAAPGGTWRARVREVLPQRLATGLRNITHRRPRSIGRDERRSVLEFYEADIRQLQKLLKLDLSGWLRVEREMNG